MSTRNRIRGGGGAPARPTVMRAALPSVPNVDVVNLGPALTREGRAQRGAPAVRASEVRTTEKQMMVWAQGRF